MNQYTDPPADYGLTMDPIAKILSPGIRTKQEIIYCAGWIITATEKYYCRHCIRIILPFYRSRAEIQKMLDKA